MRILLLHTFVLWFPSAICQVHFSSLSVEACLQELKAFPSIGQWSSKRNKGSSFLTLGLSALKLIQLFFFFCSCLNLPPPNQYGCSWCKNHDYVCVLPHFFGHISPSLILCACPLCLRKLCVYSVSVKQGMIFVVI